MKNEISGNGQMTNRLPGYIGLAKKAGALSAGVPLVLESIRAKKCVMVLAASDISENTKKKLRTACDFYGVPLFDAPLEMGEISDAVGVSRLCGAVAVTNGNFAKMIAKALDAR